MRVAPYEAPPLCPWCSTGHLDVIEETPDPNFGALGVSSRILALRLARLRQAHRGLTPEATSAPLPSRLQCRRTISGRNALLLPRPYACSGLMSPETDCRGNGHIWPLEIAELHPVFAGEVSGVDSTKPIDAEEERDDRSRDGPLRSARVPRPGHFRQQQIAFTRNFGELESYNTSGTVRKREDNRLGPGIADLSNLTKDGRIMSAEDRVWFFKLGDGFGIRTVRSGRSRPSTPLLSGAPFLAGAAIPNSPTCDRALRRPG